MIQAKSLKWGVADWKSTVALDLNIKQGEKIFIQGPNGSGKTTLLKTFAQGLYPVTGNLLCQTHNILFLPSESYGWWPEMSVLENWNWILSCRGRSEHQKNIFLDEVRSRCQFLNKIYKQCTHGERQWAHLLAFLFDLPSDLILLDEAFYFLDDQKIKILKIDFSSHSILKNKTIIATGQNSDISDRIGFWTQKITLSQAHQSNQVQGNER